MRTYQTNRVHQKDSKIDRIKQEMSPKYPLLMKSLLHRGVK